jgi:hypothetical protein
MSVFAFGLAEEDHLLSASFAHCALRPGPDGEFRAQLPDHDVVHPGSLARLTEVDITNPDSALPPGICCTVELNVPHKTPSLSEPADAVIQPRWNAGGGRQ